MAEQIPLNLLCLASYEKGHRFLARAKERGCRVFLLTSLSLKEKAQWPEGAVDDIFYMPDQDFEWNLQDMLYGVCHICRTTALDRIVPMDDFDLEKAAFLREHLRTAGMGETATRYFRDKLAMRMRARESGLRVPPFTATINYEEIARFLENVPPPWVLKPRLMAGAMGIKKCHHKDEVWGHIHAAGNQQSFFVLERFVAGDIFHVDSIWFGGQIVFAISSAYGTPPLEVTSGGGIFTTRIIDRGSELDRGLQRINEAVLQAFQLTNGVSHSEFIRAHESGELHFLETSARVGGAHISDLVEAATGINFWSEWADIEIAAARGLSYSLPPIREDYAGLLVSLARQEWPDTAGFQDPELVWRMNKKHHVGFIVRSTDQNRISELLADYTGRVRSDFHASAPARERPGE